MLFKRDDKFKLGHVNGGKLRQAISLIQNNLNDIKNLYHNTVVCYVSIKSPQSEIISEVCKYYKVECVIVSFKTPKPNLPLSISQRNGARLIGLKSGYNSVLKSWTENNLGHYYIINMGFESEGIFEVISEQVENLPVYLENLIIPVGSGMNLIGILKGLDKYKKIVDNIYAVYVGRNPTNTIMKYYDGKQTFRLIKYPKPYSTPIKMPIRFNEEFIYLDPIYEAKALDWFYFAVNNRMIEINSGKNLFWIIGKRNTNNYLLTELLWE